MSDFSASDDVRTARLASSTAAEIEAAANTAIATARAAIDALTAPDRAAESAEETLDRYDEAVAAINNVASVASTVGRTHPDETMRTAADVAYQALSAESTAMSLHPGLYAVLAGLDVSDSDPATRHYVDKLLREFRRAGVDRDEATRATVKELNEAIVATGLAFDRHIREDTRTLHVPPHTLDGLPDDFRRAHAAGDDGLVALTTDYTDYIPVLTYARDADLREQMWRASHDRAHPSNVDVLRELIVRRHELATLLGYPSWAAYATENKMIGTAEAAADFIARISELSGAAGTADYAELLARKQVDEPGAAAVFPWDGSYYIDRLKSEKLAFDTQAVRPYFEYNRVKNGLMAQAAAMFGVTFNRREDVPTWHPDVEVYDVTWTDGGGPVGQIFLDMHPRLGKFNHNAQYDLQAGKRNADGTVRRLPMAALLCNLPQPGAEPGLLQHSQVTTFFHEFGHLLHNLIGGHQRWSGISGVATEWDFVEAPSQLLEEWTMDAGTLAPFAIHYETGEPLPTTWVPKLRAADEFAKGMFVRTQMSYAAISLELYRQDPAVLDVRATVRKAQTDHSPYPVVDGDHMELSFGHLDGYSSNYYTYMWSLVIAKDLFTRFTAEGLPAPEACRAYRDAVLAAGGSAPAAELVERFLGRPYTFDAYQTWLES